MYVYFSLKKLFNIAKYSYFLKNVFLVLVFLVWKRIKFWKDFIYIYIYIYIYIMRLWGYAETLRPIFSYFLHLIRASSLINRIIPTNFWICPLASEIGKEQIWKFSIAYWWTYLPGLLCAIYLENDNTGYILWPIILILIVDQVCIVQPKSPNII